MLTTSYKTRRELLQNNILRQNFIPRSIMTRGCPYCLNDRGIPSATSRESPWHKTLPISSFTETRRYANYSSIKTLMNSYRLIYILRQK